MMTSAVPYSAPWIPEDDLMLKNAVEVGASLESLAKGAVLFSRKFSTKELRDRWHALLYHPEISAEAAACMLEVESLPKSNGLFKVKGKDVIHEKRKVDNVRSHYYAMRKRFHNESVDFPDPCYHIPQNAEVGFMGSEGNRSQEQIDKLIDRDCMEYVPVGDNFRVAEVGCDVGCHNFPSLDGVVPGVHEFHTTGAASLTNDLHRGTVANSCLYGYEQNNVSSIPVENTVGMSITAFHNESSRKDIPQMLNVNSLNFHDRLEIEENNMQGSVEMTGMFVDHDLEVKSLPVYGAVGNENDNFTGFEASQAFGGSANCKSPHLHSGHSAPEHRVPIWNTRGVLSSSSMANEGNLDNERQPDTTFLKHQVCHMKKINSSEHTGMIPEPNDAFVSTGAANVPFSVSQNEFMELSDSLLDCVNEGDLLYLNVDDKDVDRDSLDGLSSILLSSPKDMQHEDASMSRDPGELIRRACSQPVDARYFRQEDNIHLLGSVPTDHLHVCYPEVGISSAPVHNFCLPDNMVSATCLLNTEDPEIPCNEGIFPLKVQPQHSFSAIPHSSAQTALSKPSSDKEMGTHRFGSDSKLTILHSMTEGKAHVGSSVPGTSGLLEAGLKDVNHCERLKLEKHGSISPSATSMYVGVGGEDSILCNREVSVPKSANLQEMDSTLQYAKADTCYVDSFYHEDYVQCGAHGKGHTTEAILADQSAGEVAVNHEMGCLEQGDILLTSDKEELYYESEEDVPYFSDIETMILDMDLPSSDHDAFFAEEECRYHQQTNKLDIVKLERAVNSYIQKAATQYGALAVFYGRCTKHYITKTEVYLGRPTESTGVDIDLSEEGLGSRISRSQATIKMDEDGTFYLTNTGKNVISVNSKGITRGRRLPLSSGSLIAIRGYRFIFETNPKLLRRYLSKISEQKTKQCQYESVTLIAQVKGNLLHAGYGIQTIVLPSSRQQFLFVKAYSFRMYLVGQVHSLLYVAAILL